MSQLFDSLLYAVLSLSWLISILASFLWMIRWRSIQRRGASRERLLYLFLVIGGMAVWLWNGVRPTPVIFEDRAGLYWGIKTDGVSWGIELANDSNRDLIFQGDSSLSVTFTKEQGWIIFHHFPTAPPPQRYEALEFNIYKGDLQHDELLVGLYGDGQILYPSDKGIPAAESYVCPNQDNRNQKDGWECIRIPISDFKLPGGGIIGIGIGKTSGTDAGTFYLDSVRLIEA